MGDKTTNNSNPLWVVVAPEAFQEALQPLVEHRRQSMEADWDDVTAHGASREARILRRVDPSIAGAQGLTAHEFRALCGKMTNRVVPGDRNVAPALSRRILQQFFDNYPAEFTDMALTDLGCADAATRGVSHALGMVDALGAFVDQLRVTARGIGEPAERASTTLDLIADQLTVAFSRLIHPWQFDENQTQIICYRLTWLIEDKPARCTAAFRTRLAWVLNRTSVSRQDSSSPISLELAQLAHACGL